MPKELAADFPATLSKLLAEIEAFPIDDRVRLVHAISEGIEAESAALEVPEGHKRELERRIADAEANPDDVLDREEVMSWLRNQP